MKNLTENVEIIGNWFLPNSDQKIPGVFKYEDGQSTLELSCFFKLDSPTNFPITFKIIHGETSLGSMTLTNVIFDFIGVGSVYLAILGVHLTDDSPNLTSLSFNLIFLMSGHFLVILSEIWILTKYPIHWKNIHLHLPMLLVHYQLQLVWEVITLKDSAHII